MKIFFLSLCLCVFTFLNAQNQPPQISNLAITLNGDETLTVNYDLSDAENDEVFITFLVSENGGNSFQINTENATGDFNALISMGTDKTIVWNYADMLTTTNNYVIKLVADDLQIIDIQDIVNQVDSNNLKMDLAFIEGIRHRTTGAAHLEDVRDLINQRFLASNLLTEKQEFPLGSYTGENFIGTQLGNSNDNEIYILDGHYDGVDDSPAADDNGTAIAGMLEAARILSNYNFKKTIRYIGFDLEESGLVGSQNYVSNLPPDDDIAGVLNFEMIGYFTDEPNSQDLPTGFELLFPAAYAEVANDDFRGNFIANVGKVNQNNWEQSFANAAATYVPDLRVITFNAPDNWLLLTPDLGRSDHAPFWIAEHPATMLSGTANFRNPFYHTPNDTFGTINFDFMTKVVKAAVATLAKEAELQNSSIVMDSVDIVISSTVTIPDCLQQIFPNPVGDVLNLHWQRCGELPAYLKIYNSQGKLIVEERFLSTPDFSVEVKDWERGVYILKTNKGIKRFVKH